MSAPRVALVGSIEDAGPWLLRAIGQSALVFEALCAADAEEHVGRLNARWAFTDFDAMLRESQPDGVVLLQPFAKRAALIKQCLSAGVSVLVPGAPGPASACQRIASFARLCGRTVLALPAARFAPSVLLARRLIESGRIGNPSLAALTITRRGAARADDGERGCVPFDLAYEAADLIQALLGPIESVFATSNNDHGVAATIRSAAGVPISLLLHEHGPVDAVGIDLEVRGSDGSRLHLDAAGHLHCGNGSRMHAAHRPTLAQTDPAVELGYVGLVDEFVRYLRAGRAGPGLPATVSAVVATAEALLASAARGRPISPRVQSKRGRAVTTPAGAAD